MKNLVLLFCVCTCIASQSVLAENAGSCIEFAGVNGRRYCYSANSVRPFRNAFSYCHALGYHQATTNELCDISSNPSERMVRSDGNGPAGGCKNLVGVNIPSDNFWTAGLYNDTWADALVINMPNGTPNNSNPTYSGRHAVCYMGGCATGYTLNEATQECEKESLFCSYYYTNGNPGTNQASCHYNYIAGDPGDKQYSCSYTYTETDVVSHDVGEAYGSASISGSSRGGCPANQYCALKWSDTSCSTDMSSGAGTRTIYGVCSPKDDYYMMCLQNPSAAQMSASQARGGCAADEYCALKWADESCSADANDSVSVVYGVCTPKDDYYNQCLTGSEPSSMTVKDGCSGEQYCYLRWSNETCSAFDNDASIYYGVCMDKEEAQQNPDCPTSAIQ